MPATSVLRTIILKKVTNNFYWIVNLEIPVIALLYVSAVHVPFEVLPICFTCFYTGNCTEVTPWGPMTCSRTAICTVTGQGSLPYTDSCVQPKCRAARTSMVLLPIYSPKASTNYLQLWGSAKLLSGAPEGCIGKFHVQNNWKIYQATEFSGGFWNHRFARTSRDCKDRKFFTYGVSEKLSLTLREG